MKDKKSLLILISILLIFGSGSWATYSQFVLEVKEWVTWTWIPFYIIGQTILLKVVKEKR